MDVNYFYQGVHFLWDEEKAKANELKHGVSFEAASSVFFDPLLKITDATRNEESRHAVIGFDSIGRLIFAVHIEYDNAHIRIISARKATRSEETYYVS